ncbi:hypothetical protein ACH5RR_022923 [Cinchona calisaya]|uniref:Uncharacterized protein n=1 Tax=Cinchona calisaya TaxID=153742 RepID=A0ABD2Z967_9GENT
MAVSLSNIPFISLVFFLILLPHPSNSRNLRLHDSPKFFADNIGIIRPLEKICHVNKIYQLGDSISDTGNFIRENSPHSGFLISRFPYGETLGAPTGRCSNGLLMIDYFALASGLPYLDPSEKEDGKFATGVNFAVAGSTALSNEALKAMNITNPSTNSSLNVQVEWMTSHFNSVCHTKEACHKMLKKSLFLVGEIGGNDFNYAFAGGKTIDGLMNLVPDVVRSIRAAVIRAINFGATRIIVPGNFPIGCIPVYLSNFHTNDTAAYDENHCVRGLNDFAQFYNKALQESIVKLKKLYPHIAIVYGDYYNAYLSLLSNARKLGFDVNSLQKACCGVGEPYNFNAGKICGTPEAKVCPNPDKYLSWDGIHSTQQAYKYMAGYLLHSIIPQLHCHGA